MEEKAVGGDHRTGDDREVSLGSPGLKTSLCWSQAVQAAFPDRFSHRQRTGIEGKTSCTFLRIERLECHTSIIDC